MKDFELDLQESIEKAVNKAPISLLGLEDYFHKWVRSLFLVTVSIYRDGAGTRPDSQYFIAVGALVAGYLATKVAYC